jgi:thiamine-phosphate pyrophosphorylase
MPLPRDLKGLYAVTDTALCARLGVENCVAAALRGGAVMIQYRDKSGDGARRRHEALALRRLCHDAAVPLIINDDVALALEVGADGVHLGVDDTDFGAARQRLGPGAVIGVSCYASLQRAQQARANGADYVAFGSFHPSTTKPAAAPAKPALLRKARMIGVPIVAIGGISSENGAELIDSGADFLAVVSSIFASDDPAAAAHKISKLFKSS